MMSRKKKNRIRSILGYVVIFLFIGVPIILATVVQYQSHHKSEHRTKETASSNKNASNIYPGSGKFISCYAKAKDVSNPRVYMYDKLLFSENGEINYFFSQCSDVKISYSYDHTQAAITADGELCYVDGRLDPVLICNRVEGYGEICKDGGYILYCSDNGNSVKVYDIAGNEHIKVSDGIVKDSKYAISSNGKYVTLFTKNKTRIIPYGQQAMTSPVSDDVLIPIAVSDDGTRAFYYDVNRKKDRTWVYCYHDNELEEIADFKGDYVWKYVVNDDCTDIFMDANELWYYSTRNDKLRRIVGQSVKEFYFSKELSQVIETSSRVKMVDVPSFDGCFLHGHWDDFWLYDTKKEPIIVAEDEEIASFKVQDKELTYLLIRDDHVYKGTVKKSLIEEKQFIELEYKARNIVANKDMSVIWFIDTDNGLHKYYGKHMYDFGDVGSSTLLKYVPCEDKVYYIYNGTVYVLDEETDESAKVVERCRTINDLNSDYGDFAGFTDASGRKLVTVYGNLIWNDKK